MSEETVLKSSIFGGYKKQDVIEYINSILDEDEEKMKVLEEKIAALIKENKRLRAQSNKPIAFPTVMVGKNQDNLTIGQQMELEEGTYMIGENDQIVTLPAPEAVYKTKTELNIIKDQDLNLKKELTKREDLKLQGTQEIAMTEENTICNNKQKIEQLQFELLTVNEILEKEKAEKQMLYAKLDYSNELLLKLYQNQK